MARNVVAIYDNFQMANDAVRELVDRGYARENISIIANNSRGEYQVDAAMNRTGENVADETGAGAGVGASIGAAIGGIGGLLVGLGALVIPGIGPVIAAGPLAIALSTLTGAGVGAVAGGVTGGLLGALIGMGIPEEEAQYYAEGVRRGGALVSVQVNDSDADQVVNVLNRFQPVDINARAKEWRSQGWTGYQADMESDRVSDVGASSDSVPDMARGLDTNMEATPRNTGISSERMEAHYDPTAADDVQLGVNNIMNYADDLYRTHYNTNLANSGYPFEYYSPAYRYGFDLHAREDLRERDWDTVESEAQNDWERQHPGTWDRFRDAIRYGWDDPTRPV